MLFLAWLAAVSFGIAAFVIARDVSQKNETLGLEVEHLRKVLENLARSVAEKRKEKEPTPTPAPKPAYQPAPAPASAPEAKPNPVPVPERPKPQPQSQPRAEPTPEKQEPKQKPWFAFDWESLVGIKLFSAIAAIATVIAAILLFKLAIDTGWLTPSRRALGGLLWGAALLFVCELRIARNYKFTANAMHGAGIAILYATLFAIYARWHLAPAAIVFPLMIGVTAVAVWLSIRRESVFIAMLGLLGGFATPALLSTGDNRPIPLFIYLLLLNIGLAWVAMRRRWTLLAVISVAFTAIYQWGWIAKFLTTAQLSLAAAIFVIFSLIAASSLWIGRRDDREQQTFDQAAVAGASLPLFFAIFAAAVPQYGARYNVLFGFLFLVAAGLAAIALARGPRWIHLLGGVTTLFVFAI